MVAYTLNTKAVDYCRSLIDDGRYVLESSWSKAQPSAERADAFIDENGWDAYAQWNLGIVDGTPDDTKEHFGFVYGDFEKVHRSGLAAAAERAGQYGHEQIERAAHDLLEHLKAAAGE